MKKICFFLIIFLYQTFSYAKTTENIEFNHKYLSNYFSAIISINNQDDKDSLKYLNNSKTLVKTHESYLENYLISLVLNNKIDIAFNKAIQLKANETNFFEAKVLLALDSINKKDFSNKISSGTTKSYAHNDFTLKVDVKIPLKYNSKEVYYRFIVNNNVSPIGKTKTLPILNPDKFNLAFCSCSNYPAGFFNAYREIAINNDIDLVLHLGDYLYEYGAGVYAS